MKMYSLREVAEKCGVKVRTVREWIKLGKIHAQKSGNDWYWLVPEDEVDRINANKD